MATAKIVRDLLPHHPYFTSNAAHAKFLHDDKLIVVWKQDGKLHAVELDPFHDWWFECLRAKSIVGGAVKPRPPVRQDHQLVMKCDQMLKAAKAFTQTARRCTQTKLTQELKKFANFGTAYEPNAIYLDCGNSCYRFPSWDVLRQQYDEKNNTTTNWDSPESSAANGEHLNILCSEERTTSTCHSDTGGDNLDADSHSESLIVSDVQSADEADADLSHNDASPAAVLERDSVADREESAALHRVKHHHHSDDSGQAEAAAALDDDRAFSTNLNTMRSKQQRSYTNPYDVDTPASKRRTREDSVDSEAPATACIVMTPDTSPPTMILDMVAFHNTDYEISMTSSTLIHPHLHDDTWRTVYMMCLGYAQYMYNATGFMLAVTTPPSSKERGRIDAVMSLTKMLYYFLLGTRRYYSEHEHRWLEFIKMVAASDPGLLNGLKMGLDQLAKPQRVSEQFEISFLASQWITKSGVPSIDRADIDRSSTSPKTGGQDRQIRNKEMIRATSIPVDTNVFEIQNPVWTEDRVYTSSMATWMEVFHQLTCVQFMLNDSNTIFSKCDTVDPCEFYMERYATKGSFRCASDANILYWHQQQKKLEGTILLGRPIAAANTNSRRKSGSLHTSISPSPVLPQHSYQIHCIMRYGYQ
eukprot:TRINITY_DN436_c1_g1_i1.p1 TRINITY_DN436_c1_g1~~TRINITY_DN436_c1_g1_i1.p1  ORF type:complete len:642 (-),score=72.87 TRINITY_DN436_c1_g1_i1:409-2334(-)